MTYHESLLVAELMAMSAVVRFVPPSLDGSTAELGWVRDHGGMAV